MPYRRLPFDVAAYEHRVRTGECFVCGIVRGDSTQPEHVIYRDHRAIAFLSRPVLQLGYSLVAPLEHHEDVVESFDLNDYLGVQEVVYRLGKALTETLPIERLYVMSLGSRQGNAHVHWHVVPLPPGVPYAQQQFNAVMLEHTGSLAVPEVEQADLAARLAAAMRVS